MADDDDRIPRATIVAMTRVGATSIRSWMGMKKDTSPSRLRRASNLERYTTSATSSYLCMLHLVFVLTCNFFIMNQHIPCYARPHVCDFVNINDWRENEKKDVKIKTKHGITLKVEVFNEPNSTYFDCQNWSALCKAYALEEDMQITFDLGPRRQDGIRFRNEDIWMLVDDMKLVLSPREFLKQI